MSSIGGLNQQLNHIAFMLARQSDQVLLERLGIGYSQFKILLALQEQAGMQQRAIAGLLGQTEASVSRQIKLLQAKGLISSQVDPNNRRVHIAALSAKGARLADEAVTILNAFHGSVVGSLNEKQQVQLAEILAIMHAEVCGPGRLTTCSQV